MISMNCRVEVYGRHDYGRSIDQISIHPDSLFKCRFSPLVISLNTVTFFSCSGITWTVTFLSRRPFGNHTTPPHHAPWSYCSGRTQTRRSRRTAARPRSCCSGSWRLKNRYLRAASPFRTLFHWSGAWERTRMSFYAEYVSSVGDRGSSFQRSDILPMTLRKKWFTNWQTSPETHAMQNRPENN